MSAHPLFRPEKQARQGIHLPVLSEPIYNRSQPEQPFLVWGVCRTVFLSIFLKISCKNKACRTAILPVLLLFFCLDNVDAQHLDLWQKNTLKADTHISVKGQLRQLDSLPSLPSPLLFRYERDHESSFEGFDELKDSLNHEKRKLYGVQPPALYKTDPDSIRVTFSFEANPVQNVTPMDNTLARGPDGKILSAVNANFGVYSESGTTLYFRNFRQLAATPSLNGRYFDPRVAYDPLSDRYFMLILHGTEAADSRVLLFVSSGSDPAGAWQFYPLSGNPFNDGRWADYPHLAIGTDRVWISFNQFSDGENKFQKSLVYAVNKQKLLQNNQADFDVYSQVVTLGGKSPFSLVPAPGMDKQTYPGMFFVSSKTGGGKEAYLFYLNASEGSEYRYTMELNEYGAPPDALQANSSRMLDAGDCRVTGAYLKNELIHFCMNVSGPGMRTAVFYGRADITNGICAERRITGKEDRAYAYPAPFGNAPANRASLLALVYSSENAFPSLAYVYVDDAMKEWGLTKVIEGQHEVELLSNGSERWGDYTGAVPDVDAPVPSVWLVGAVAATNGNWENHIVHVTADPDSLVLVPEKNDIMVFPNPSPGRIKARIDLPRSAKIEIGLYDSKGVRVLILWDAVIARGENLLEFDMPADLSQGVYFVRVRSGNKVIHSDKLMIE